MKIRHIDTDILSEIDSFGMLTSQWYTQNNRIAADVKKHKKQIYCIDSKYYKELIEKSFIFFDYFASTRKNTNAFGITPSLCTHQHKYTPGIEYFGIKYEIKDEKQNSFFKLKFSPYFVEDLNRVELNLGIVVTDPKDVVAFRKYFCFMQHTTLFRCTNLSPASLYIMLMIIKLFCCGLDKEHPEYSNDVRYLNNYVRTVNKQFEGVSLSVEENGILKFNKKINSELVHEIDRQIPLKRLSSYCIIH